MKNTVPVKRLVRRKKKKRLKRKENLAGPKKETEESEKTRVFEK